MDLDNHEALAGSNAELSREAGRISRHGLYLRDSDVRSPNVSIGDQIADNTLDRVGRDCKANACTATRRRSNLRVDTNHFSGFY